MARSVVAILAAAAVAAVAAGCGNGVARGGSTSGGQGRPPSSIDFDECGDAECGTLTVPLDRADPGGPTIELALVRVPAARPDERLGVLLTNPGGPGAGGVDYALARPFPQEVLDRFDLIGWDPRGVGGSAPLACGDNVDRFLDLDPGPDSRAERRELNDAARAIADECAAEDGALLPHIGTVDVVADMDAIRVALGEDQISYAGLSYGTALGLGYLERFGARTRAMVLDGVVDPSQGLVDFLWRQGVAIEGQLDEVLASCDDDPECPLDDAAATFDRVAGRLDRHPVPGGDGSVGPAELQTGATYATYGFSSSDRADLFQALHDADRGDGDGLAALAQEYYDLGEYTAYAAVECVDSPVPRGAAAYRAFAGRLIADAPRLGASVANELLPCAFWPARAGSVPHVVTAPAAPAVLVVGNTGDPATPYEQAVDVADDLGQGRLLTLDAAGHVGSGRSRCVDDAVAQYLLTLQLPADGTTC